MECITVATIQQGHRLPDDSMRKEQPFINVIVLWTI